MHERRGAAEEEGRKERRGGTTEICERGRECQETAESQPGALWAPLLFPVSYLADHLGDGREALECRGVGRGLAGLALGVGVRPEVQQGPDALGVAPVGAVVQRRPAELQGNRLSAAAH